MELNKYKLVVFGCSFTFGHGLPDCVDEDGTGPGTQPSKMAWSNHLQTFGKFHSLDNKGIPGASNKIIVNEIVNYDFNEPTVVIVLWSNFERKTIFKEYIPYKKSSRIGGSFSDHKLHMMPAFIYKDHMPADFWRGYTAEQKDNYSKLIHQWYEDYHYDHDCMYENTILINYAHAYMKSKGVKDFHLINKHNINKYKNVFNDMKIDTLQAKTFHHAKDFHIDDALDKQRYTAPHPGVKSQIHFAKNIMKWFFK